MKGWLSTLFVAFAMVRGSALVAQDITGTWQGTLHSTTDIREVIKISKDAKITKAVLFGIDSQPGQSFPSLPLTFQGNPSSKNAKGEEPWPPALKNRVLVSSLATLAGSS